MKLKARMTLLMMLTAIFSVASIAVSRVKADKLAIEEISSFSFRLIELAVPELVKAGLSLEGRKITVLRSFTYGPGGPTWGVIFSDEKFTDIVSGSPPPPFLKTFEVGIDISGKRVTRAHFSK